MSVKLRALHWLAALVALVYAMTVPALSARAFTVGTSPGLECLAETISNEIVEKSTTLLDPPNGATVQAGTPVTFSGQSGVESPLTFMVASSPALLSSPDIDSGPGALQSNLTASYTFTSTKAATTPGTIYWAASFTRVLHGCEGPPVTFTTPARTLTVLSSSPAGASPPPSMPPPRFQLSISASGTFMLRHPTVTYRIRCTTSCSGNTYVQAWQVRPHRKAIRTPELGFGPMSVSITAASGGRERFTHHYSARALRKLRSILQERGAVELKLSVNVTDASGTDAQAHSTAWLRD